MKTLRHLFIILMACSFASQAFALKSDRDQPADIEADDIEFDFKKGTRTYIDNVLAIQGTLRLKADKLFAEYNGSELKKATMWGSLARFKQRPDGKEHDVEGWAKKIVVDQQSNTLTLLGKAALKQGGQTARGDTIIYNMANDTLKVKGSAKLGSGGKDGAKPRKKIKDPFADSSDGPPPAATKKVTKKQLDDDAIVEDDKDEAQAEPEPVKEGRSRLIINPK